LAAEDDLIPGFSVVQIQANESYGNYTVVETQVKPVNYSL
jgi:hypothetical protein